MSFRNIIDWRQIAGEFEVLFFIILYSEMLHNSVLFAWFEKHSHVLHSCLFAQLQQLLYRCYNVYTYYLYDFSVICCVLRNQTQIV